MVYGYVNYATAAGSRRITFEAPPTEAGRIGSTLGGTGIAVTRRTKPSAELLDHIAWLLSPEAQLRFIPGHDGQPSARTAWTDREVNAAAGNFYANTLSTIQSAWVRPRFAGYVPVQTAASELVRRAVAGTLSSSDALEQIADLFSTARTSEGARS